MLREIADGYTGRESAFRIGITFSAQRSHVEALKGITGCSSSRELGRWWRKHRGAWIAALCLRAGVTAAIDDPAAPFPERPAL